ncbi:847_t:CDS:10 [Diversispora eburnea]|uniref:Vacuolar protein sorting-associated protein 51 homolog n=1 Tax=Diversispora eburnea TaxID=1213867 RepID=A0A9N8VRZ3_9GLOM|nr:847_t:CDS:10 [Diversispora eburnea]
MTTKTPTLSPTSSTPSSNNTISTQPHVSFASAAKSSAIETAESITLTLPHKGRRAKNLLRNYYGLGPDGKKANPFDIEIRQLDGDMKTLVYENYSKFISATDTIRKMKSNVESMESEMQQLSQNITEISNVNSSMNTILGPKREKIRQLTGVHDLLKKIQFIFELPKRLKHCLDQNSYTQAVKYYAKTSRLLEHYRSLSVFSSIEVECKEIMDKVIKKIKENMNKKDVSVNNTFSYYSNLYFISSEMTECMRLLIALKEPPEMLAKEYLELDIKDGRSPSKSSSKNFEYVFANLGEEDNITDFQPEIHLQLLNELYFSLSSCRSLCSIGKLDEKVKELIDSWEIDVGKIWFEKAEKQFMELLSQSQFKHLRTFAVNIITKLSDYLINDCLRVIEKCVKTEVPLLQINGSIKNLLKKFQIQFRSFWYSLITSMIKYVTPKIPLPLNQQQILPPPSIVILIISRILLDFGEFVVTQELAQDVRGIVGFCKDVSQRVLERYLEVIGNKLSKNIRDFYGYSKNMKFSSDDDDNNNKVSEIWIKTINELTFIEKTVMALYGPHEEIMDDIVENSANLMSNIDKLFSDRIEIFGIAEFSKVGIMLGIIKIMLKTWIEMIRIQTLTQKTFQQIQIDSEYMRIKLWKFIEDERVLNTMLQELASSVFKRCAEDPAPLDNAVIEKIVGGI